mgnify:CR=1 FL=1
MQTNASAEPRKTQGLSFAEQVKQRTGSPYMRQPRAAKEAGTTPAKAVATATEPAAEKPEAKNTPFVADAEQLRRFVQGVFRNCIDGHGKPLTARLVLRAFTHRNDKCVLSEELAFGSGVVSAAVDAASRVANRPADGAAVFAPPPCLFSPFSEKARQADIMAAPVIAVDLDEMDPEEGHRKLEKILGPATIVIASGGIWTGPDGRTKDKLHLYWRLSRPARETDEIWLLNSVRKTAAKLAGGDTTAASPAHPLRWPGSWHTKGEPRLCRIIGGDDSREIDLADAARLLNVDEKASAGSRSGRPAGSYFLTKLPLAAEQLADVVDNLPNKDLSWEEWNERLMAFYDASHDSEEGKEAARRWSAKSTKHDDDAFEARWDHIGAHPPERLSAKSLERFVQEAQAGTEGEVYILPPSQSSLVSAAIRAELADLWKPMASPVRLAAVEPADIFGDEPPVKLKSPPEGCLPDMLARWVRSEARRKGASEAFTAAAALTTIGSAIGNSLTIQVRARDADFAEPASLWCVLLADPGSAKSPVISAALKPLREIDSEWLAVDRPRHAAWATAAKVASRKNLPPPPEPRLRRAAVDDITAEAQIKIHEANPRGIMRSTDEFTGITESLGAYKRSGGGDRSMMLRLFDGESVTVDRVSSGNLHAKKALMGILAGSQPDKIKTLVQSMQVDGLLQRFLFIMDEGEKPAPFDEEADAEAARDYRALIRYLVSAEYLFPEPVKISPEGRQVFQDFIDLTRKMCNTPGMNGAWIGHLGKWEKIAARFVLTFHAIEQFELLGTVDPGIAVGRGTVERAMAFCRFALRHQFAFYSRFFAPDERHDDAVGVAGFLLTRPGITRIKRRDIYHARTSLKGRDNLRKLLDVAGSLVDAGWLAVSEREADGPVEWAVNPLIHERFAARAELEQTTRERKRELIAEAAEARRALEASV